MGTPEGGRRGRRAGLAASLAIGVALGACGSVAPEPASTADHDRLVTIAFGGDVNLGRRQNAISARDGPEQALEEVPTLREADVAIVNLESVVSAVGAAGVEKGESGPFYFRGRPEMLNVLVSAGVDAVATANNHSGDYGPDALLDQAGLLDVSGIAHAGSGVDRHAACEPALLATRELTVALVSVDATMAHFSASDDSPGTCYLPLDDPEAWREGIGSSLEQARRVAHVVLVAVHWGPNLATEPSPDKRAIGRLLVELGADAVLGSSAHVLQGIEIHDGRPIIHDAGNLLFDSQEGVADSALFVLEVARHGVVGLRIEPLVSDYGVTSSAQGETRDRILAVLRDRSGALGTALDGDLLALDPPPRDRPSDPLPPPARRLIPAEPAAEPPPGCVIESIPSSLEGRPQELGPLTFLGARVDPVPVEAHRLGWVESFWRVDTPIPNDLWLSPRLEPTDGGDTWRGDHEPCDWGWPTSRMVPGVIYRDRAPLRPRDHPGIDLVLRVGVTDGEETIELSEELARVPVVGD